VDECKPLPQRLGANGIQHCAPEVVVGVGHLLPHEEQELDRLPPRKVIENKENKHSHELILAVKSGEVAVNRLESLKLGASPTSLQRESSYRRAEEEEEEIQCVSIAFHG